MEDWSELGQRVAEARASRQLTQGALAEQIGLDRTAVSRIESGTREIDFLELARIARVLQRPLDWFLTEPLPSVASWRRDRAAQPVPADTDSDAELERLAGDVQLLVELDLLAPPEHPTPRSLKSVDEAIDAARDARTRANQPSGPIGSIQPLAESLGLFAFVHELGPGAFDGGYLSLPAGGVALINGSQDFGRRRFTLAHEFGHHFCGNEYATDWKVGDPSGEELERLLNVFAIHLLIPDPDMRERWGTLRGESDPRAALIRIGAEYKVSWSAVCAHAKNCALIDEEARETLVSRTPTKGEMIELGVMIVEDLAANSMPTGFVTAVVRAYRHQKIGRERALELVRGTLEEADLPDLQPIPIEAIRAEFV